MAKAKRFEIRLRAVSAVLALAIVLVPAVVVVLAAQPAQAQTYSVLFSFHHKRGNKPYAGVIEKNGSLYGTTYRGGVYNEGTVFKLNANGKEKVLYSFTGGADGRWPKAGLVRDSAGNLYGTTQYGGAYDRGVVFNLDTTGMLTVLYSFTGGADGADPFAGLVRDSAGNLYGTAEAGGAYGRGVVFKVDTTGAETVLYSFTGGADGAMPHAGLVRDHAGNLYGTTLYGGKHGVGGVFKLRPSGKERVLHSFKGGADGAYPYAGLVRDSAGNLYGTTYAGGNGGGVVFELDKNGAETVLYSFTGGADGRWPKAGLVRDSAGNLYGTTEYGGPYYGFGSGGVFKLDTTGGFSVLYSFTGGADGGAPLAGLLRDSVGNLYGTTKWGGAYGKGVVFKITPQ